MAKVVMNIVALKFINQLRQTKSTGLEIKKSNIPIKIGATEGDINHTSINAMHRSCKPIFFFLNDKVNKQKGFSRTFKDQFPSSFFGSSL